MIDLDAYLESLIAACKAAFGERLLYVGLQGSYLRGEATEDSDVDIMLLIDRLTAQDLDEYRTILDRIGNAEKSCGFLCGRDEMARWNPLEIRHLRHTTKDFFGALENYLPDASRADEINFVKLSLGNLYHELCHRYVHADRETNRRKLCRTLKGLFFLMQDLCYLETGTFAATKRELSELVSEEDRAVLRLTETPDPLTPADFDRAFRQVFDWCQNAFVRASRLG